MLINWDKIVPTPMPIISDKTPINNVSKKRIIEIRLLLIPRVKYIPNSLFLLFIKNLEAYMIRKPNINDTNTLTALIIVIMSLMSSLVDEDTSIIAVCVSKALNT